MNILLPIAPQDALGRSPSLEVGATPEGVDGTGFAEALTAVLVVPMTGEARPPTTAIASPQVDGALIGAVPQGGDEAHPVGNNQSLEGAAHSGDLDFGLGAQAGLHDPSLQDGAVDNGTDLLLPSGADGGLTDHADRGGADAQTKTAETETSPLGREEGRTLSVPGHTLTGHADNHGGTLTDRSDHRNPVPLDVARVGLIDEKQVGPLPAAVAGSLQADRIDLAERVRPDPAAGQPRTSTALTTGLGSARQELVDASQRGTAPALLLMAQQTRSSGVVDPALSAGLTAGAGLVPAPSAAINSAVAAGVSSLQAAYRDPARLESPLAAKSNQTGAAIGPTASSHVLPEPSLPAPKPSTARPATATISDVSSDEAVATQGQRPSQISTNSQQNQTERLQGTLLSAQSKQTSTGAAADPSLLQPAIADVAAQPDVEVAGGERFQPFLAAEGDPLRLERLDSSTTNVASPRLPATPSHPAASGQIALQILHSASDGIDRVSLQLHPAELGSVDIELSFEGAGRLSALITAERPETLELLQRDSRLLERSLGDSGLKLTSDGLSFALKQDHQQQQPGQNFQQQSEAQGQASDAGRAYDEATDVEQAPSVRRIDGVRLLDIET